MKSKLNLQVPSMTIMHPTLPNRFAHREYDQGAGVRFVGRCKCGDGLSHLATTFVVRPAIGSFLVGETAAHAYDDNGACLIPCACGRVSRVYEVKGRFSAKHVCNAKCLAGKTGACECSCGGRNHGAAWG